MRQNIPSTYNLTSNAVYNTVGEALEPAHVPRHGVEVSAKDHSCSGTLKLISVYVSEVKYDGCYASIDLVICRGDPDSVEVDELHPSSRSRGVSGESQLLRYTKIN